RGDITISCEKISIIYDENVKTAKKIIAEGQVRITQGERIATGERAVFNNSEEKITLTGRPQLREGDNTIEGGKITLFLAEDRGVVEADKEIRVNATIQMEKNTREKKD
ncbi:MAG: LptA/OstA family protein, partial [Thermodesulfobacteriota bacterium]|nr:LptA/OstA family protein [Thermodesulfobacteriota bacterium]